MKQKEEFRKRIITTQADKREERERAERADEERRQKYIGIVYDRIDQMNKAKGEERGE